MNKEFCGDRSRANRINAKASTGPRTSAGKARSSKNALRHGLNIPIWSDPTLGPQAEVISRRIVGPGASDETLERARRIGAAQSDLIRVRARRRELIRRLLEDPEYRSQSARQLRSRLIKKMDKYGTIVSNFLGHEKLNQILSPEPLEGNEKLFAVVDDTAKELARLDRYERRALSRRKTAIRDFDKIRRK